MNVLMLSLMYPRDTLEEVSRNAKDKLQIQIDSYQRAFAEGIRENLGRGEALDIINALPVGVFPKQYSKALLIEFSAYEPPAELVCIESYKPFTYAQVTNA